jgi:hypothetical protein
VQTVGNLLRRPTTGDQLGDHPFAFGEAVQIGDRRRQLGGPGGLDEDGDPIRADERPAHDSQPAASGTNPGGGQLALVAGGRAAGLGDDGADGDRQRDGGSIHGPQLIDPPGCGGVGHLDGVIRGDHHESGVTAPVLASADAVVGADVVLNAVQGVDTLPLVASIGADNLDGTVLWDIANAANPDFSFAFPDDSLGRRIQEACPGIKVVKAGNHVAAVVVADPSTLLADALIVSRSGLSYQVGQLESRRSLNRM